MPRLLVIARFHPFGPHGRADHRVDRQKPEQDDDEGGLTLGLESPNHRHNFRLLCFQIYERIAIGRLASLDNRNGAKPSGSGELSSALAAPIDSKTPPVASDDPILK